MGMGLVAPICTPQYKSPRLVKGAATSPDPPFSACADPYSCLPATLAQQVPCGMFWQMMPSPVQAVALLNSRRFTAVVEPTSAGIMKVAINLIAKVRRGLGGDRTNLVSRQVQSNKTRKVCFE